MKTEVITKNNALKPQLNPLKEISARAKINIATHIKNTLISEEIKQIILLDLDAEKNSFYFCVVV